jgi:hypothetical protein
MKYKISYKIEDKTFFVEKEFDSYKQANKELKIYKDLSNETIKLLKKEFVKPNLSITKQVYINVNSVYEIFNKTFYYGHCNNYLHNVPISFEIINQ